MPDVGDLKVHIGADVSDAERAFSSVGSKIGGLGSSLANVASTAGGFVLGGAITAMPGLLMDAAKGAAEDEQATLRLQQTVKNLGGDYGATIGKVNEAIAAGQKLAFTDDQVRNSYQFLAQATGSSEEALSRQTIAMDLARGANIPLEQAMKLVGKVNEENVDTFRKLGIEMPKNATEAEALAAIQAKYAGQSEIYANSTAGQFEQAQIAIAETQEALGAALLPALAAVGNVLVAVLPTLQEWVGTLGSMVGEAIEPVIEAFRGLLDIFLGGDSFDAASEVLDNLFPPAVSDGIMFTVAALGDMFRAVFEGDIPEALFQAQEVVGNFGQAISDAVELWGPAFVEWIGPMSADMLDGLAKTAQGIGTWLIETAATIVEELASWAAAFLDWIGPMIPDMLRALGGYVADMTGWIAGTALPMIVGKLAEWGLAFVEWIAPRIPPMLAAAGELLGELGVWIVSTALPAIVAKLIEWGTAFAEWIPGASVKLMAAIVTIEAALGAWIIGTALPAIVSKLLQWGDAFTAWIATEVLPALPGKLAAILTAIGGWISSTATSLLTSAKTIGTSIIDGIVQGIRNGVGAITSAARDAAQAALDAAIAIIRPGSPSIPFTLLGKTIPQGLALGIVQDSGLVASAALAMAEAARQQAMASLRPNQIGYSAMMGALGATMGQNLTPVVRQFGQLASGSIVPGQNNTPSGSIPIGAGNIVPSAFSSSSRSSVGGRRDSMTVNLKWPDGKQAGQIVIDGYDQAKKQGWTPGGLTG